MFALAERLAAQGQHPVLVDRLIEEASWGLDWVLRVRFGGGYRVGFGAHNFWSNNIAGDGDDRFVEAKNNPNANYIAAAAGAIAARVLRTRDPARATEALRIARDDWAHAIVGIEGPSTWHTPAFAASRMELAGIGITASIELWHATHEAQYRDKAVELARIVMASQQVARVGSTMPLSGFFTPAPIVTRSFISSTVPPIRRRWWRSPNSSTHCPITSTGCRGMRPWCVTPSTRSSRRA